MKSCLYEGRVRHRRYLPRRHAFGYRLFMVCLDVDELDTIFAGRWLWSTRHFNLAWFRRADHLGPSAQPLKQAVLHLVQARLGFQPEGPVFLVTHLRYFGHGFNPVSFYYCHAQDGQRIEAIVAEINNTPWGERYSYVLDARNQQHERVHRFRMKKVFHVSPFMSMTQTYDWRFSKPALTLIVHMVTTENGQALFDATLSLERQPINGRQLARVLMQYPLVTVKVIAGIYWQALRLWLKRIPCHTHPTTIRKESLP